jgi:hypothetical protein
MLLDPPFLANYTAQPADVWEDKIALCPLSIVGLFTLLFDDDAAQTIQCDATRMLHSVAEPFESALAILEETLKCIEASAIELMYLVFLFLAEHVLQYHTCLDGQTHTCQPFKAQPALV